SSNSVFSSNRDNFFHWLRTNRNESPPRSQADSTSGTAKYEYWEKWTCHCSRSPRRKPKKSEINPNTKARDYYKNLKHVGCKATLFVHKYAGAHPLDPNYGASGSTRRVLITYFYVHSGHELGSLEGFQHLSLSVFRKRAI
ncbi:hypothetical protein BGZ70_006294, partial [Mortierella alpina]